MSIRPNPSLPGGPFEFSVLLLPKLPSGEVVRLNVPIKGRVWEDVEALPSPLNLGQAKLGGVLEEAVELKSRVSLPFRIESIVSESHGTVVTAQRPANGRIAIAVRQTVLAAGQQNAQIKFVLRDERKGVFAIILPICFYGLEL
jgi:hypothetical protein